jgi:hypothetical protein
MGLDPVRIGTNWDCDGIYYKIIVSPNTNLISICTLQAFDEDDYDQSRFVCDSDGRQYLFATKHLAIQYAHKWYRPDEIDPEFAVDRTRD